MKTVYLTLLHSMLLATVLAFSHILLKLIYQNEHETFFVMLKAEHLKIIASLSLYGFVFAYYVWVLKFLPISWLYPVYTGLSIALVALAGHFYFGEALSTNQVIGIIVILFGIVLFGL